MKVICIGGHAQHGKDTLAGFLKWHFEETGRKVLIMHYADQLKFICRQYFGWDGVKDESGRTLLQHLGTDVAREKDPEIWVKYVAIFLRVFGQDFDYVLIPDCRFPNEIDWVNGEHECVSIRIERPNFDNGLTPEQKAHPSETALDNYRFDIRVRNKGSLSYLDRVAEEIASRIICDNLFSGSDYYAYSVRS